MDDAMTAAAEARARATLAEEQSKIKTEEPSALLQSGHGDGVTKVIREEGGTIAAYAWSAGTASWERVGEVTGVGGGGIGGGKKSFQGAEYDYVFDVDFQDGVPPLKLPFNVGDNPYTAAETFLETNDLPAGYREQVVNFIVQNVGETNVGAGGVSADPFTGAGAYVPGTGATTGGGGGGAGNFDPFTGGGAYVPGAAAAPAAAAPAAAAAAARQSYVPTTTCLLFDTSLNLDGILKKIAEFAAELATAAQRVEGLRECAAAAASKTPPSTTAAAALLDASAAWPKEKLFPLLDVARMLVLVPGACDAATSGAFAAAACRALESGGDGAPAPPGNVLTAGRLFANAFKHGETRDAILPFGQALLVRFFRFFRFGIFSLFFSLLSSPSTRGFALRLLLVHRRADRSWARAFVARSDFTRGEMHRRRSGRRDSAVSHTSSRLFVIGGQSHVSCLSSAPRVASRRVDSFASSRGPAR